MARSSCGSAMSDTLVACMAISDLTISICYVLLPLAWAMLFKIYARRGTLPSFGAMDVCASGAFVFTCGVTHVVDALMFFEPMYRVTASALMLCAGCSVTAAVWFISRAIKEA